MDNEEITPLQVPPKKEIARKAEEQTSANTEVPLPFLARVPALRFIRPIPSQVGPNQLEVPPAPVLISDEARRLTSSFSSPVCSVSGSAMGLSITERKEDDIADEMIEEPPQIIQALIGQRPIIGGARPPRHQELVPLRPPVNGLGLKMIRAYVEYFQLLYPRNK